MQLDKRYLTVSALNQYIKAKIDSDYQLQKIFIKGEISNLKKHSSGHFYFTLKDEHSRINAIMFANKARYIDFNIKDGDKVFIEATVSVYVVNGVYQLYVDKIEQDGIGNLFLKFDQLKKKLASEGLFDEAHKKEIPHYPSRIAVLTAYPSAALMDIMQTIKMRFPMTRVVIFPIPVQGKDAYLKIVDTLKYVDSLHFHTIIIARGGGSLEDLWNFNEELLARTIYDCQTPIISGVGHEVDFTICDFVADCRCATPTAAAIKATPDLTEMRIRLNQDYQLLFNRMNHYLDVTKSQMQHLTSFHLFKNPEKLYVDSLQNLIYLKEKMTFHFFNRYQHDQNVYKHNQFVLVSHVQLFVSHFHNRIDQNILFLEKNIKNKFQYNQDRFFYHLSQLNTLSPLKTLERGYAIISKDDKNIDSIKDIKEHDQIEVMLKDGKFKAVVKEW